MATSRGAVTVGWNTRHGKQREHRCHKRRRRNGKKQRGVRQVQRKGVLGSWMQPMSWRRYGACFVQRWSNDGPWKRSWNVQSCGACGKRTAKRARRARRAKRAKVIDGKGGKRRRKIQVPKIQVPSPVILGPWPTMKKNPKNKDQLQMGLK